MYAYVYVPTDVLAKAQREGHVLTTDELMRYAQQPQSGAQPALAQPQLGLPAQFAPQRMQVGVPLNNQPMLGVPQQAMGSSLPFAPSLPSNMAGLTGALPAGAAFVGQLPAAGGVAPNAPMLPVDALRQQMLSLPSVPLPPPPIALLEVDTTVLASNTHARRGLPSEVVRRARASSPEAKAQAAARDRKLDMRNIVREAGPRPQSRLPFQGSELRELTTKANKLRAGGIDAASVDGQGQMTGVSEGARVTRGPQSWTYWPGPYPRVEAEFNASPEFRYRHFGPQSYPVLNTPLAPRGSVLNMIPRYQTTYDPANMDGEYQVCSCH